MRDAKIDRVKRRLLQEAVAENLEVIRGGPPRAVRTRNRISRLWLRRAPLLLVPLTLAASSYFVRTDVRAASSRPTSMPPAMRNVPLNYVPRVDAASLMPLPPEPALQKMDSAAAFPLSVRRIVVDAGHGGSDPGTTSPTLSEKAVTLDIALRLEALLEKNGYEVIVTRERDQTLALRERARLANASTSDIFVSIHVNSLATHTTEHGVETYYLGPTNDPKLTQLAAEENRGSGYSIADLRKLLDGVYADARRDQSRRLAAAVQEQLYSNLSGADVGLQNWGVKRAPFLVLVATDMPAILAEVGCMSNDREAHMLGLPNYRQRIAEALFRGIAGYARTNEG